MRTASVVISALVATVVLSGTAATLAQQTARAEESRLQSLTAAAERGDAAAEYELGVLYANGDGVPTDYALAARWFGEAARHGAAGAERQLKFMADMGLAAPAADAAFHVQVASVSNEEDGPREWRRLQRLHPEILGTLSGSVVAFDAADGARLFRVEGGPLDEDGARAACAKLREAGAGCRVVKP